MGRWISTQSPQLEINSTLFSFYADLVGQVTRLTVFSSKKCSVGSFLTRIQCIGAVKSRLRQSCSITSPFTPTLLYLTSTSPRFWARCITTQILSTSGWLTSLSAEFSWERWRRSKVTLIRADNNRIVCIFAQIMSQIACSKMVWIVSISRNSFKTIWFHS